MTEHTRFNFGVSYEASDGHGVREHSHECSELVYYLSCCGATVIGGKSYDFSPGTLAVIRPHTPHSEQYEQGGRLIYIGLDAELHRIPESGIYHFADERIPTLMRETLEEVRRQRLDYELMVEAKLSQLCVILARHAADRPERARDISYVKNYIDENYNLKISFSLIAAQCGCSYSFLRHRFKQLYGIAPQNYLVRIRLKNAYRLLSEGVYNCTEVCYMCGFSNSAQFSKMFKREYGTAPGAVRKYAHRINDTR